MMRGGNFVITTDIVTTTIRNVLIGTREEDTPAMATTDTRGGPRFIKRREHTAMAQRSRRRKLTRTQQRSMHHQVVELQETLGCKTRLDSK